MSRASSLGCLVIALLLLLGGHARADEALSAEEQRSLEPVSASLAQLFESHTQDRYDPELRTELLALLADYRAALPGLVRQWMLDAHALEERQRPRAVYNRFLAELTVLRMEPVDDAKDDARWLAAVRQPQSCVADFEPIGVQPLLYLQALPKAQRAAALKAERARLQRFGKARGLDLKAPLRELLDDDRRAIQAIQAIGFGQWPALPPVLAELWLGDAFELPMNLPERCAATQWWLKLPATKALPEAEQLAVVRYAMAPRAADIFPKQDRVERARITDGTGAMQAFFCVSGTIKLLLGIDKAGKVVETRVLKREVHAPGVGVALPPLAFETLLDAPAAAKARTQSYAAPPTAEIEDGLWHAEQEFQFNLK